MSHFPNDLLHRTSSSGPVIASRSLGVTTRILTHAFLLLTALGLAPAVASAQTAHSGGAVNFGSIQVGSSSATMPVTFTFDSGGTIEAPAVLTLGAPNLDFTDAGTGTCTTNGTSFSYNIGETCTVNVKFSPKYAGPRNGAVVLSDSSGAAVAIANIYGEGLAPQVAFSPSAVTVIGGDFVNSSGVTVDGSGNVYLADPYYDAVYKIPPGCASFACASAVVKFGVGSQPAGPAVDGTGSLYVAMPGHGAVYRNASGVCDSTLCDGTVGGGFLEPYGLAVDASGNVYVTDADANSVWKIPPGCNSSACMIRLGGGFSVPKGVAVDASGNVYVADTYSNAVKEMPAGCASSACVASLGGGFSRPTGVAVDSSGNVYVADNNNNAVKEIPTGCASSDCVKTLNYDSEGPYGIALDGSGNVYVADASPGQVKELQRSIPSSLNFASTPADKTSSDSPQTVTIQNIGNTTLDITNVTYSTDFPEASGVDTDCTSAQPIASGAYCTLSIEFSPLASSETSPSTSLSESINVTDNNLNGTNPGQSVAVSGIETTTPYITSPLPGSPIAGPTSFMWSPGAGWAGFQLNGFQLSVGNTGVGSSNIYQSPVLPGSATSSAPVTISTPSGMVYVRLWYLYNAVWDYRDYTYNQSTGPTLVSPLPGSLLSGPTTFKWNPSPAVNAGGYQVYVGTTGAGSNNIYQGPDLPSTATSSASINFPMNGATVYVRLWYVLNNSWLFVDYTYAEMALPSISTPTQGSAIGSPTTFTWNSGTGLGAAGVTEFQLYVGTTGAGSSDIYLGPYLPVSVTSSGPINITKNSPTVYVRFWYQKNSSWQYQDYTYTEALVPPSMSAPTPGSTIGGATTFTWAGRGVSKFQIYVGTTGAGSHDFYLGPDLPSTATSSASLTFPSSGATLYVRLWYLPNNSNSWLFVDYTYTETATPLLMSTPTPGSTIGGPTTFTWKTLTGATEFQLYIGTTGRGSANVYRGPDLPGTAVSSAPISIPNNGVTAYVRLWYVLNGSWQCQDYTYTEATAPSISTPVPGSTLGGPTTFTWNASAGVSTYQIYIGTTGTGSSNLYKGPDLPSTATSSASINIPSNGATLYVRLWYVKNSAWLYEDYTYKEQ